MQIVIFVYDGMTALDAIGPYDPLSRLPQARISFAGLAPGPVTAGGGVQIMATELSRIGAADVLIVPGGMPDDLRAILRSETAMEWLRHMDAVTTYTCSVCTGALLLAAAGLLKDRQAATHWRATETLARMGVKPAPERVHLDGKYLTSAGVTAGIDMGITLAGMLAGREVGEAIELSMHYAPQPPFGVGDPDKHRTPERVKLIEEQLRH